MKAPAMQTDSIFEEGDKVYAKTVDEGQKALYIEEVLPNARYKLRESTEAGVDVLMETYAENDLSDEPFVQGYVQAPSLKSRV